jgi:hypothetical protein
MARKEMAELLKAGIEPVFVPRLACLKEMRAAGLNFIDAAARKQGVTGKPFDLLRAFMVQTWVKKMDEAFADVAIEELLP